MLKIYLAGAIDGVTEDEAWNWRVKVERYLEEMMGCKVYNPMRIIESLDKSKITSNEMVGVDLKYLKDSDILLVNLTHETRYVGSICEMVEAKNCNIPVIVYGDMLRSRFLDYYITKRLTTEEEALEYIATVFTFL